MQTPPEHLGPEMESRNARASMLQSCANALTMLPILAAAGTTWCLYQGLQEVVRLIRVCWTALT